MAKTRSVEPETGRTRIGEPGAKRRRWKIEAGAVDAERERHREAAHAASGPRCAAVGTE